MLATITLVEEEIRRALSEYIARTYGVSIAPDQLPLMVKSKQNYKGEWEQASMKIDGEVVTVKIEGSVRLSEIDR